MATEPVVPIPETLNVANRMRPETVAPDLRAKVLAFPASSNARKESVSRFERLFTIAEMAVDFILVAAVSMIVLPRYAGVPFAGLESIGISLGLAAIMVMLLQGDGSYALGSSLLRVRETERVLRAWSRLLLVFLPIAYFFGVRAPTSVVAIAAVGLPLIVIAEKNAVYVLLRKLHGRGYGVRKVVIYGAGMTGRRIYSLLTRSPKLGLKPVAFVDDDPTCSSVRIYETAYIRRAPVPVLPGPVTADGLRSLGAQMLIVGIPGITQQKLASTLVAVANADCLMCLAPNDWALSCYCLELANLDGTSLVIIGQHRDGSFGFGKNILDLLISTMLLLITAPLLLTLMVIIRLTSPGPAIFCQDRIGKNNTRFRMYKFRSMYMDAPQYDYSPIKVDDSRITPIGRFLRRTSLDELPQLLNVLKGDMSLVGPRPEMPFIVDQYNEVHQQRLLVKPGLTGLWQLSADRANLIHENLEYDLYYIRFRTFFMDLAVLFHTLIFAARGI